MINLKNLLAITDFSESASQAARRAALIALQQNARFDILHVMNYSALLALQNFFGVGSESEARLIADARQQLEQLAAEINAEIGITPTVQVEVGHVLNEVMSATDAADMLVLGAHGTSPLRDLAIGSLAERLLGKCTLPVLITHQPPRAAYQRVLVAVDFSTHSRAALKMAIGIAPEANITVAHAFEVPFEGKLMLAGATEEHLRRYRSEAQQQALSNVRKMMLEVAEETKNLSQIVEQGDASVFILEHAEDFAIDLIVIGKHGQSLMEELLLGSVTRHVLANAKCDVLVVHA
jgi:nucleotide-binding universal stress UspA family protein